MSWRLAFSDGAGGIGSASRKSVGFPYQYDAELDQYLHPAGLSSPLPTAGSVGICWDLRSDARRAAGRPRRCSTSQSVGPADATSAVVPAATAPLLGRYTLPIEAAFVVANLAGMIGLGSPSSRRSAGGGTAEKAMYHWVPFWPRTAAVSGEVVNTLFIAELGVCGLILLMVVGLMFSFCLRYRARQHRISRQPQRENLALGNRLDRRHACAFFGALCLGSRSYIWLYQSPPGDLEIYVVGKQWMWKMEHPGGQREIDALHVPVGKTVRLVLASQDVIHSFYIPAFRIKHDVVPGTYETVWFKATTDPVRIHIECSEFCGTAARAYER